MNQYPMVDLLVKRGPLVAALIAALPVVAGLVAVLLGAHWLLLVVGVVGGGIAYVLMKSYVEVVAIIADMLLPK